MFGQFNGRFFGGFFGALGAAAEESLANAWAFSVNPRNTDVVWNGRANVIQKALQDDQGVLLNAPALGGDNKVRVLLTDRNKVIQTFDSVANPTYFSADLIRLKGKSVRCITLKLGDAGLTVGEYDAVLSIYTEDFDEGLVVGEFRISVRTS